MKYMLIAGEASGDLHASQLITALAKGDPEARFRFFGGDLMAKASRCNPEIHYDQMNVMGFSEVFRMLPTLLRNLRTAKRVIQEFRPDALILVDYPSFNLKLAKYAHKLGIPVYYFISPKIWAWKEWRIKRIRKYVDHVLSILPFETEFYKKRGYDKITYVGNPSVQEIDDVLAHIPPMKHFLERQGLTDGDKKIIAILPGSRCGEIRNNLPMMIEAAKRFPDYQYVVAAAPAIPEKFYREVAQDPGLNVVFGATQVLLKYSHAAIVTSGTATLETALLGVPQVVCYRSNGKKWTYKLMEKLLNVKYVSLPNLVMNNNIVPELLLYQCNRESIARELSPLLQPSPQRDWQVSGYKSMRRRLGTSVASKYAAEIILNDLGVSVPERATEEETPKPKKRRPKKKKPAEDKTDNNNGEEKEA